jgi:hypothetical protein
MTKMKNLLRQLWVWAALFIAVLSLGLYVRFYPLRAHIWSDSVEQATVFVLGKVKAVLAEQINTQYADMPQAKRNQLIEERFAQTLHEDSAMVRKTIAQAAENLRRQSPPSEDRVYLQEADGYYYLDLTENILKTGHMARQFKGSKYLNEKMAAPFGFWQPINLHPYFGFTLYKLISAFKPGITLVRALCYSGPVLSALALAAFVGICYILRLSPLASAVGAVYFYLAPIFVKRSTFAWYDDDSHNVLFPLLILGVVFHALKNIRSRRDSVIFGVASSLAFSAYALFWHGWGYIFGVVMISGVLIVAADLLLDRQFKPHAKALAIDPDLALYFVTILAGTAVFVSLMFGPAGLLGIFAEGFGELRKFTTNQLSLWPNLFVAVGELKRSSLKEIMEMTGNAFSFCGALLSIPLVGYTAYNRRDRAGIFQLIILTVLLAVDIKITLGAERFILLILIPISILFAMGLSSLVMLVRGIIHPIAAIPEKPSGLELIAGIIIAAIAVFFPVRSINGQIAELLNPIYNATWEKALVDIKEKTPADSIITTWWPPGHFIKAIADRRVTFDGATLSKSKEAYWVANIFITSDERKAAGILRMLNTSGTNAVDYLESLGLKTSEAVALLHEILPQPKEQAAQTAAHVLPAEAIGKLLSMTHGTPPPSYLLIYSELMDKNIGLEFVGKWNFQAIETLNKNPEALKKIPSPSSPEFFEFLWSTMGGPYKYSEALIAIGKNGPSVDFDEGLHIDMDTMSASINSRKYGQGRPASIVYFDGSKVVERTYPNRTLNYSVVLFQENSRYYCRLMDRELANSLLVKFFIFKGRGMDLFKPLTLQSDMTGRDEVDVFELQREKL